jgi:hypothetical protein
MFRIELRDIADNCANTWASRRPAILVTTMVGPPQRFLCHPVSSARLRGLTVRD